MMPARGGSSPPSGRCPPRSRGPGRGHPRGRPLGPGFPRRAGVAGAGPAPGEPLEWGEPLAERPPRLALELLAHPPPHRILEAVDRAREPQRLARVEPALE